MSKGKVYALHANNQQAHSQPGLKALFPEELQPDVWGQVV